MSFSNLLMANIGGPLLNTLFGGSNIAPTQADSQFFGHKFYVEYPKDIEGLSKKKKENLQDRLSKAMEEAHRLYNRKGGTETWSRAVEKGYEKYGLLKPLEWVGTRAHELNQKKDLSYEDAYERAYKEWIKQ